MGGGVGFFAFDDLLTSKGLWGIETLGVGVEVFGVNRESTRGKGNENILNQMLLKELRWSVFFPFLDSLLSDRPIISVETRDQAAFTYLAINPLFYCLQA